jgi:flagellar protein FlaH
MSDDDRRRMVERRNLFDIYLYRDELAARFGGGIPKGSTMLIEGVEGSGRSALCQRILYGLLSNGHSATYVSTELTLRDFIDQMYSLDYNIGDSLIDRSLQYFPVYPLIGQSCRRNGFLDKLVSSPQLYDKDVLFIDSLTALIKNDLTESNCIQLMGFLKKQTKLNKTIVMTADEGFGALEPLRQAADIYLRIKMRPSGQDIIRTVHTVRYQRAKRRVDDVMNIRIEPGAGLIIEITEVSG